jgi:hypothetical protein
MTGMGWQLLPETCCKYFPVRSNAASMRHTVSGNSCQPMPGYIRDSLVHQTSGVAGNIIIFCGKELVSMGSFW